MILLFVKGGHLGAEGGETPAAKRCQQTFGKRVSISERRAELRNTRALIRRKRHAEGQQESQSLVPSWAVDGEKGAGT